MGTKIEWAEETWNPIVGCSKVSPGCDNCYAEGMANRLAGIPQATNKYSNVIWDGKWSGTTSFDESALEKPFQWKKPRTIFVSSMGDLFHSTISFKSISKVFSVTQKCPQHTFLILTKRPATMWRYFQHVGITHPYLNVWLGVTAENQEQADKRIPILLSIPAAKRFVSIEPMLGPISFRWAKWKELNREQGGITNELDGLRMLDWVICGGESGPGARPMHPYWARLIRDQCIITNVPFMFKQWGEWAFIHYIDGKKSFINLTPNKNKEVILHDPMINMRRVGKKKAGRELDGKIWNQKP